MVWLSFYHLILHIADSSAGPLYAKPIHCCCSRKGLRDWRCPLLRERASVISVVIWEWWVSWWGPIEIRNQAFRRRCFLLCRCWDGRWESRIWVWGIFEGSFRGRERLSTFLLRREIAMVHWSRRSKKFLISFRFCILCITDICYTLIRSSYSRLNLICMPESRKKY